jgi:hypothetical protein
MYICPTPFVYTCQKILFLRDFRGDTIHPSTLELMYELGLLREGNVEGIHQTAAQALQEPHPCAALRAVIARELLAAQKKWPNSSPGTLACLLFPVLIDWSSVFGFATLQSPFENSAPMSSARQPEAFISNNLFEAGIGYAVVSRFKSGDRAESGVFLLDVFCLGVKNAMFNQLGITEYGSDLLERLFAHTGRLSIEPCCARKLVEGAVRYAAGLSFQPHRDYKAACRVFGGISADACEGEFVFGHRGKPLYVQGPYDSPQKVEHILAVLDARCGNGNFEYLLVTDDLSGVPEEIIRGARVVEIPNQDESP